MATRRKAFHRDSPAPDPDRHHRGHPGVPRRPQPVLSSPRPVDRRAVPREGPQPSLRLDRGPRPRAPQRPRATSRGGQLRRRPPDHRPRSRSPVAAGPSRRRWWWCWPWPLAWGAWEIVRRGTSALPGLQRTPVVAVMPLTNLTGEESHDATAAGIAEVVVGSLSAIDGVQVLSRSSTAAYRDRKDDLPGVARELDASYLLDGVLQQSHEELRVSLSLIQIPSNVVRWSGSFDGAFPRLFELQSRLSLEVAHALRLSLSPRGRARVEARPDGEPHRLGRLHRGPRPHGSPRSRGKPGPRGDPPGSRRRGRPSLRPGPRPPWKRTLGPLRGDRRSGLGRAGPRSAFRKRCGTTPMTRPSARPSPGSTRAAAAPPRLSRRPAALVP